MKFLLYTVLALLGATGVASAHHAAQSQFDVTKVERITGVLKSVDWINPHAYLHFVVLNGTQQQEWAIETFAPSGLKRAGIASRKAFQIGDTYQLGINPSRDGSNTGLATEISFPNGTKVSLTPKDPGAY